jgi:hypothetical protein
MCSFSQTFEADIASESKKYVDMFRTQTASSEEDLAILKVRHGVALMEHRPWRLVGGGAWQWMWVVMEWMRRQSLPGARSLFYTHVMSACCSSLWCCLVPNPASPPVSDTHVHLRWCPLCSRVCRYAHACVSLRCCLSSFPTGAIQGHSRTLRKTVEVGTPYLHFAYLCSTKCRVHCLFLRVCFLFFLFFFKTSFTCNLLPCIALPWDVSLAVPARYLESRLSTLKNK